MNDLPSAAGYAEATVLEGPGAAERRPDRRGQRAGQREPGGGTRSVLEKRPGHMQALRAQALARRRSPSCLATRCSLAEALAMVEARRARLGGVRAPRSEQRHLAGATSAVAHSRSSGNILQAMGRPATAAATLREQREVDRAGAAKLIGVRLMRPDQRRNRWRCSRSSAATRGRPTKRWRSGRSLSTWPSEPTAPPGSTRAVAAAYQRTIGRVVAAPTSATTGGRWRWAAPWRRSSSGSNRSDEASAREKANCCAASAIAMAPSAYALEDFAAADREMAQVCRAAPAAGAGDAEDKREIAAEQRVRGAGRSCAWIGTTKRAR